MSEVSLCPIEYLGKIAIQRNMHLAHEFPGWYVGIEGIDGTGKSALLENLADALYQRGFRVIRTREPGGTPTGLRLRRILEQYNSKIPSDVVEALFMADREIHVQQVLYRHLAPTRDTRLAIVLSDRTVDSGLAYRAARAKSGHDGPLTETAWGKYRTSLRDICDSAAGMIPNHTIYLHASPGETASRLAKRWARDEFVKNLTHPSHEDIQAHRQFLLKRNGERFAWLRKAYDQLYEAVGSGARPTAPRDKQRTVSYIDTTKLSAHDVCDTALSIAENVIESACHTAVLKAGNR